MDEFATAPAGGEEQALAASYVRLEQGLSAGASQSFRLESRQELSDGG